MSARFRTLSLNRFLPRSPEAKPLGRTVDSGDLAPGPPAHLPLPAGGTSQGPS